MEECKKCIFFRLAERSKDSTWGYCHRYPPQVITDVGGDDGHVSSSSDTIFPIVGTDEFCGEFEGYPKAS